MMFIISVIIGIIAVFIICIGCYLVFWSIVNVVRIVLFRLFDVDLLTHSEKIRFGIIKEEVVQPNSNDASEGFDREIVWKKMNAKLDLDLEIWKSSRGNDLYFQAIIKKNER